MDPATRTNLLIFGAAMLILAAIWLIISGFAGAGLLSVIAGLVAGMGAAALVRVYLNGRRGP